MSRSLTDVVQKIMVQIPQGDPLREKIDSILSQTPYMAPEVRAAFTTQWDDIENVIYYRCPDLTNAPEWYMNVLKIWANKM
jgi:hypothetical protein